MWSAHPVRSRAWGIDQERPESHSDRGRQGTERKPLISSDFSGADSHTPLLTSLYLTRVSSVVRFRWG